MFQRAVTCIISILGVAPSKNPSSQLVTHTVLHTISVYHGNFRAGGTTPEKPHPSTCSRLEKNYIQWIHLPRSGAPFLSKTCQNLVRAIQLARLGVGIGS